MKFSMMTYTMMRQKCYTPEDCVRVAKELNMDGIDWVTTYDRDARELKKLSDDAGLPVVAHTFFLRKDDMPQIESVAARHLDDAVTLGAPVVMIPPSPHPDVTTTVEECRKLWIGILKKVAPLAAERNLQFSVENFPNPISAVVTSDDFYALKAEVPELKLTFDNGNAASGEDQIESLRRCFKDIVHVHFKDWTRSDTPVEGWKHLRDGRYYKAALIGEGAIDSRATLRELEKLGYDGYINIEYENNTYPGDVAIKRALEYLRG